LIPPSEEETATPTPAPTLDIPVVTDAPETEVPETEVPETEVPETEVPETEVPETEVPETEVPETEVPGTEVPGTEVPETEVPETEVPETEVPGTEVPSGGGDCATIIQQDGNVTYIFIFIDRPPNDVETEILVNATTLFFSDTYTVDYPDTFVELSLNATNTTFDADAATYILELTGSVLFSDCAPALEVFQATIDAADYAALWRDYVVVPANAAGDPTSVLGFVSGATYEGQLAYA